VAEWLSLVDAAKVLGKTRQQVWRYCRSGRLPYIQVGGSLAVSIYNVTKFKSWLDHMEGHKADDCARKRRS
jgi:Helix-turn-helix domain